MKRIAIFASGSGSNAENIIEYFREKAIEGAHSEGSRSAQDDRKAEVVMVLCNNKKAGVIERCRRLKVDCMVFDRSQFYETDDVLNKLVEAKIDLVVLAGFL